VIGVTGVARHARARTRARGRTRGGRLRLPRPSPRTIAAVVAAVAILGGAYLWVRQSSLVAVRQVQIAGLSGPDAPEIRSALVSAARTMTTLDVQVGRLDTAVSPYPVVKGLRVTTHFPHGLRIVVVEQVPVAIVDVGGERTAVAADGTLLHGVQPAATLPTIALAVTPGGTRVTGTTRGEVRMLAAAPYELLARISTASSDSVHGVVAQLRSGPQIDFGDATQLAAKWRSALQVLADPHSAGAGYIDVTVPSRPAAGIGPDGGTASSTQTATPQTATPQTATPQTATTAPQTATTSQGGATTPASPPGQPTEGTGTTG
jgi:cell division protein FtsQ